ncbi:hypothetical protein SAMN04489806_1655 [Paramicrobacterium humi]|uniref:Uncharacterized protein n=1 Tax=Paramicrobacterium humi TaxID=640635 RepID=A0A1H4LTU5_9MICO|nr:hypothetical protein SAMN04489806_1655 [Microbacterium humi]
MMDALGNAVRRDAHTGDRIHRVSGDSPVPAYTSFPAPRNGYSRGAKSLHFFLAQGSTGSKGPAFGCPVRKAALSPVRGTVARSPPVRREELAVGALKFPLRFPQGVPGEPGDHFQPANLVSAQRVPRGGPPLISQPVRKRSLILLFAASLRSLAGCATFVQHKPLYLVYAFDPPAHTIANVDDYTLVIGEFRGRESTTDGVAVRRVLLDKCLELRVHVSLPTCTDVRSEGICAALAIKRSWLMTGFRGRDTAVPPRLVLITRGEGPAPRFERRGGDPARGKGYW